MTHRIPTRRSTGCSRGHAIGWTGRSRCCLESKGPASRSDAANVPSFALGRCETHSSVMTIAARADAPPASRYRLFAEVAVNAGLPHRQTFSYGVPDGLDVRAGDAVHVPFGRRVLQGIVVEVHDTPVFSEPEKIRPVTARIGGRPLLDDARLRLARWIAAEYLSPVYDAVALFLPPGFEQKPRTLLYALVDAGEVDALGLPPRLAEALRAIATQPG